MTTETTAAPAAEEYEFPVSDAQSRLLVLDQLDPGTPQYHVPAAFAVRGPFDPAALGRALDAVVARHEALRTVFRTAPDGAPRQVVRSAGHAGFTVEHGVPADRAGARLLAEAARPFDTADGPLLRCLVLALDDGGHRILLVAHHLVCDGWSLGVLLDDLSTAYREEAAGRTAQLPPLELQFADFAAWQQERAAVGEFTPSVAHWAERLRGAPAALELPLDHPRPPVRTAAGAACRFVLDAGVRDRLARAATACGTTPFTVLFAAYAAFLGRLTGSEDLVVGFPVSGRDRPELQEMVGMLTNILALRVDLSGDPGLHELTGRIRAELLAARPYEDAPFDAVVDALAPERETSVDPVVQVVLAYDDETALGLSLAGAECERLELALDTAKFDFHLHVERWGEDLAAQFIHRTDLYDRETARRWTTTFTTLLDSLLDAPTTALSALEAVPAAERDAVIAAFDRLAQAAPTDRLVPDLIADVAAARPDAVALVCSGVTLTYRELLERADTLAVRLRAEGVGPGERVGLLLPRSPELGIAALAVLRAGGAYVPLDRAQPHARLEHMVTTSGTRLLVTAGPTAEAAARLGVPCLRADEDHPPAVLPPGPVPAPEDLAYVLFTSGSTGTPKGVAVEHRALANLTRAVRPVFPVTAEDRVLQFAAFGFDVAVSDLFFPWTAGAELHIPQEEERLGEALLERLRDSRITYVFLPPSAAMMLPDLTGQLPDLRTVAVGGEACPAELVERLAAPGRRVVNAYGPSEVTVYSTTADLEPGEPVVLGHAVPGVRVYVLDAHLRPVPAGVTGEIHLTGASLARGYINRPGLTAERFVADPYGPPGSRMYRTGDLGRVDAHGVLHYLGRGDWQVKLRGVRIELGEIEAQLAGHPDVAVVAAAVRGQGADQRLAAYYVTRPGATPTDASLRAHLAERLPGFMIPEVLVPLPELPLNGSGKVDRARLPDPGTARRADHAPAAAGTGTEAVVAEVWARVLTVDQVGAHDNFFDLGGNSVRMLGVLTALREAGADAGISLIDLFRHPTVTALAAHLDRAGEPPAAPADDTPAGPAAPGGDRHERRTATARRLRTRKGTTR